MLSEQEVIQLIAMVSGKPASQITPDMELVANLGLNSAKALELLVKIEDRLDIEIEEEVAGSLNTVADILRFVGASDTPTV